MVYFTAQGGSRIRVSMRERNKQKERFVSFSAAEEREMLGEGDKKIVIARWSAAQGAGGGGLFESREKEMDGGWRCIRGVRERTRDRDGEIEGEEKDGKIDEAKENEKDRGRGVKRGTTNGPMSFLTWYRDDDDRDSRAGARAGGIDTFPLAPLDRNRVEEIARRHEGRARGRSTASWLPARYAPSTSEGETGSRKRRRRRRGMRVATRIPDPARGRRATRTNGAGTGDERMMDAR